MAFEKKMHECIFFHELVIHISIVNFSPKIQKFLPRVEVWIENFTAEQGMERWKT